MVEFIIEGAAKDVKGAYRVCMYHPKHAPKGQIHVIPSASDKPALFKERGEEGWVEHPSLFPTTIQEMAEETAIETVESDLAGETEVLIPADVKDVIQRLLKGEKVKVGAAERKGFSLTTLCRLMGKNHKRQVDRKQLRPLFDGILEGYGDRVEEKGNCWYFRG